MHKGSHHTEETRRRLSAAHRGRKQAPEHVEKRAAAIRGMKRPTEDRTCERCGTLFIASKQARFCSDRCKRGARGATLLWSEAFARFPRECAICLRTTELVGDHNYAAGEPRGILCRTCNLAIGNLRDDPTLTMRAAYLKGGDA